MNETFFSLSGKSASTTVPAATLAHLSQVAGEPICLPAGRILSWQEAGRGARLHSRSGMVWVTQEGEGDIVLAPGESHRFTHRGRVLVESLRGEACLALEAA